MRIARPANITHDGGSGTGVSLAAMIPQLPSVKPARNVNA